MSPLTQRRRVRRHGFTLLEVTLALIIFLMMTLVFAAVFPIAVRAAKMSSNYAQATQIAQHKIDQLRAAGIGRIDAADLSGEGVIDTPSTTPSSLPYTFTFTGVDNLVNTGSNGGYFPPGSTGTLLVQDYRTYMDSQGQSTNIPVGDIDYVTVTIMWKGGGLSSGSYTASSMIVKMKHN